MHRKEFIKATLALPAILCLPSIVKGKKQRLEWRYDGKFEKDNTSVSLYFYKSPQFIQKEYKQYEVELWCENKKFSIDKLPFSIINHGGLNSFSKDFYWLGMAEPTKPLEGEYDFLDKKNRLTIGFKTENSKWYESPINTNYVYLFLGSKVIATLRYISEFEYLKDADCFLTSACVFHKGLSDNCYELTQLRQLREEYMRPHNIYSKLLQEYKVVAPQLLREINVAENKNQILNSIYEQLVKPAVGFLEMGEKEKAVLHYTRFVEQMKRLYL